MLEVEDLTISYGSRGSGSVPIESLSYTFNNGTTAIMGPSGSGKSSLLRVVAGLQKPTHGEIRVTGGGPRLLIHQDYRLVDFLTVEENIQLCAEMNEVRLSPHDVEESLAEVGLSGFQRRMPESVSGGEQQRVAISRSIAARPSVLLADEPTGALDPQNSRRIATLLRDVAHHRSLLILVATHDPEVAAMMDSQLKINGAGSLERGTL